MKWEELKHNRSVRAAVAAAGVAGVTWAIEPDVEVQLLSTTPAST